MQESNNMSNWYRKAQAQAPDKVMFILRGLPGSGKSTKAKQLAGDNGVILSTDDFFMINGEYQYDPAMIGEAHFWNETRAQNAIENEVSPIVIDNTNVEAWQPKKYVEMALAAGYDIKVEQADTPWAFNAEELAKRNTHEVPQANIEEMLSKWHPDLSVDDILSSEKPKFSYDSSMQKRAKQPWQMSATSRDFANMSVDELDRAAFGFSRENIKMLHPGQIEIKWRDDLENVLHEQASSGLSKKAWAKSIDLSQPIDVIYENGLFKVDNGHHRWYAASILDQPLPVNLEIKDKPHRIIVDKAIAEGKYVPPEVLADYPDLAQPQVVAHISKRIVKIAQVVSGNEAPDGYFQGDAYKLTGGSDIVGGATYLEAILLEGHREGEMIKVPSSQTKDEQQARLQDERQREQEGFRNLRENAQSDEPYDSLKVKKGDIVVRFTHADGMGLLNNAGLDRSNLTDEEEFELIEEMDLGLQQPMQGTKGMFFFTLAGEKKHARLLELLTKASKKGVIRSEFILQGKPTWMTDDGQLAIDSSQVSPVSNLSQSSEMHEDIIKIASITFYPSGSEKVAQPKDMLGIGFALAQFAHQTGVLPEGSRLYSDDVAPDGDDWTKDTGTLNFYLMPRKYHESEWVDLAPEERIRPSHVVQIVDLWNEQNPGI